MLSADGGYLEGTEYSHIQFIATEQIHFLGWYYDPQSYVTNDNFRLVITKPWDYPHPEHYEEFYCKALKNIWAFSSIVLIFVEDNNNWQKSPCQRNNSL